MKTDSMSLITLCGLLTGIGLLGIASPGTAAQAQGADAPAVANPDPNPAPTQPPANAVKVEAANTTEAAKPVRLSSGLDEVVKLTKAGVDESVILAFVQNSSVAYHPSAQEIIKLRELGISSAVITALLHRGEELHQRA